jgi:hypothetical protein
MTRPPGTPNPAMERADGRTLRLSTAQLDTARLRQLLVFERTLRAGAPVGATPEEVAHSYTAALAASGLDAEEVEAPLALLRRFGANRCIRARLAERLVTLEGKAATDASASERTGEIRRRMAALDDALRVREDPVTLTVLEANATEILSLFAGAVHHG